MKQIVFFFFSGATETVKMLKEQLKGTEYFMCSSLYTKQT